LGFTGGPCEGGLTHPSTERLETLLRVVLQSHGLVAGQELAEAEALWAAVAREAPQLRPPFDRAWFGRLLDGGALSSTKEAVQTDLEPVAEKRRQDWGDSPDTTGFIGRTEEISTLRSWIQDQRCRLLAVLGMGGIGKTSLVARMAQEVAPGFERVYWRSLRNALPPGEWVAGAIGFLSDQRVAPPTGDSYAIPALLELLRERRCLLVLDNSETLFEAGQGAGRYRADMAGYGRLLQAVGSASHQSCLVLTSREAPAELTTLASETVRSLLLTGLNAEEVRALLSLKDLSGTAEQWAELTARLGGNGLALKVVGEYIRELFAGELGSFLTEADTGNIFGGIRRLLAEQIERSSASEQQVLCVLAIAREPLSLSALLATVGTQTSRGTTLEAVEALRRRSLVEFVGSRERPEFTVQSVVLEYVTDRLVEVVTNEIERGQPELLVEQPLMDARAKEYVRQAQERLIGTPIVQRLEVRHGRATTEQRLMALVDGWRGRTAAQQGTGPGNVVNLLRLFRGDLCGLDLSRLSVRHALLAEVAVRDTRLVDSQLTDSVLAEAFTLAVSLALSGNGALLAAGTTSGQVWVWQASDRTLSALLEAHAGPVLGVALGTDGRILVTSGADRLVRTWDLRTGRPLATLHGHTSGVWSVALSATGDRIASASGDGTVRLWEASTGRLIGVLEGHRGVVRGVALSACGRLAASGGEDGTVRLWDTRSASPLANLEGHTGGVYSVALSTSGDLLASAGADGACGYGRPASASH
jgi:hypothetical protein